MKKRILLFTVLIFIGCNNSGDKEIATLQNNTWTNQYCDIQTLYTSNETILTRYSQTTYTFTENIIFEKTREYSDEKCINPLNSYSEYVFTYYDLGLKENTNGYEVHDIKIEREGEEKDALYAINQNKLCFSRSIYNESGISFYTDGLNNIDYEECLIKK